MQIVNITMVAGRDEARKANMVAAVTDAIAHTLDTPREAVRIIINEVPPWHFALGGVLKGAAPRGGGGGGGGGGGETLNTSLPATKKSYRDRHMIQTDTIILPAREPIFDVAELSAFELFTPRADETLWFFKTRLGMVETGSSGDSVFLRGWQDAYRHSLVITQRDKPGMGHATWRASSAQALQRRVHAIEATGLGRTWVEGEGGIGPAYEYTLPDGSVQRIHWEATYFEPEAAEKSILLNRPQRRPLNGVPVRGLDHINLFARDVTRNRRFLMEALGYKLGEYVITPDNTEAGA